MSSLIEKEITQGAVLIGTPKAYQYDAALVEAAKATVQQGMTNLAEKTEEEKLELDGYTEEKKAEVSTVGQGYVDSASQKVAEANTILSAIRNEYGYPFTAATAADMTDTSKIYVYVGSETGYTNGNWYYNNGTAWVSGGVYNAVAVQTDKTLTVGDVPADAKITGDAIKSTKAEMSLFGVDDLLWDNTNPASKTQNGVTFAVDKINKTVTISTGENASTGNASLSFFAIENVPAWLQLNKKYYVRMYNNSGAVLRVSRKINGTWDYNFMASNIAELTLDSSVSQISIEIVVWSGTTINTVVRPFISESLTLDETLASTKAEMSLFGIDDLLWDNTNPASPSTTNGITYTLDKINKIVTVSGTSDSYSAKVFYTGAIPAWLVPGKTYYANMDTKQSVFFQIRQTVDGVDTLIADVQSGSQGFVIDSTATVVTIRLYVKTAGEVLSGVVRPFVSDTPIGTTEEYVLQKCNDVAGSVSTETLNALNKVDSWELNAYINESSGNVIYGNVASGVSNLISVPKGTEIHIHGASRLGLYNDDGSNKSVILSPGIDYIVSSNDASYVRISRAYVDPATLDLNVAYYYKAIDETQSIEKRIDTGCDGVQYAGRFIADTVGNPIVLRNCGDRAFQALDISGATSGEKITICDKNVFAIRHQNGTFTRNNVYFTFSTILNTIRIRSTGATDNAISGFVEFGDDFKTVNGSTFYHNFKVRFPVDTRIFVTDNANGEVTFDFGVQMRVYDGTTAFNIGTGGTSILCEANKEYVMYFLVKSGWVGDITYAPQVEINDHATNYERYKGVHTVIPSTGNENIFECGGTAPGRYTTVSGKIMALYDSATNEIYINANNDTSTNVILYDTSKDGLVNGEEFNYIFKFTATADEPVYIKMFDEKYARKMFAQVSDGTNITFDYLGRGIYINAEANTEYAVRIVIIHNQQVNCILKPVIATGIYAIKEYGTHGDTTIYTDGFAVITAKQWLPSTKEKSERAYSIADNIITLTGGHISTPFGKLFSRGAMVSFIDDDTTNATYVQRYHDIFTTKGQLGGYAVETKNLNDHEGLPELLLEYETEGFACLYHCYYQSGDATRYWIKGHPDYNQTLINENFMRGLREIKQYGFSNYKYWVTPYGVNDKYIVDLAKNHGMECLLNCPGGYSQEGFVSPYGNISRWNIPRIIFGNYTNNDDYMHRVIQGAKSANGWVVIVSHVNSWGDNVDAMTTRLSNLIQYCIDEGVEIVPFPVGYEEYKSAFLLNELL